MNALHYVEILIILGIIATQIKTLLSIKKKIKELKDLDLHDVIVKKIYYPLDLLKIVDCEIIRKRIQTSIDFPESEESTGNEGDMSSSLLYSNNHIASTQKIIREINTYMLKNDHNMINFDVIRDITNRNFQVLDDDINHSLPTPLYLGLAATMFGIVIGLGGMALSTGGAGGIGDDINSLIIGVGIAMTSSLIGLTITTYLSTHEYKYSKREADEEKNEFFSHLQAELLPELLRSGETGIAALNKKLNTFGRVSEKLVDQLTSSSKNASKSLKQQYEIIERIDRMDIQKVSAANIEIFDRLEKNLKTFEKFSAYWERLNSSMSSTNELVKNLESLVNKFDSIDTISDSIKSTLGDYNTTMRFFTEHIEEIKEGGGLAKKAVTLADVAFRDAISDLTKSTTDKIQELGKTSTNLEVKLNDIGDNVAKSLKEATEKHLKELTAAYSNSLPEFKKLNELDKLTVINDSISTSTKVVGEKNSETNEKLTSKLDGLERAVKDVTDAVKNIKIESHNSSEPIKDDIQKANGDFFSSNKELISNIELGLRIAAFATVIMFGVYSLVKLIF